jgi:hypothetical protein
VNSVTLENIKKNDDTYSQFSQNQQNNDLLKKIKDNYFESKLEYLKKKEEKK